MDLKIIFVDVKYGLMDGWYFNNHSEHDLKRTIDYLNESHPGSNFVACKLLLDSDNLEIGDFCFHSGMGAGDMENPDYLRGVEKRFMPIVGSSHLERFYAAERRSNLLFSLVAAIYANIFSQVDQRRFAVRHITTQLRNHMVMVFGQLMPSDGVLDCHFCGRTEVTVIKYEEEYHAYCCICGAQGPTGETEEIAMNRWKRKNADNVRMFDLFGKSKPSHEQDG